MIFKFLGFLILLVVVIVVFVVGGIVSSIFRATRKTKERFGGNSQSFRGGTTGQPSNGNSSGSEKQFSKEVGEYVDFEEIKDDDK